MYSQQIALSERSHEGEAQAGERAATRLSALRDPLLKASSGELAILEPRRKVEQEGSNGCVLHLG